MNAEDGRNETFNHWRKIEYLIIGNTLHAVKRAFSLVQQGKEVLLAVEETFLAADIGGTLSHEHNPERDAIFPDLLWENGYLHPDGYKRFLEMQCIKQGVSFCYGLYFMDVESSGGTLEASESYRVQFASKGGIYSILCNHFERFGLSDAAGAGGGEGEESSNKQASYAAWISDEESGYNRILRVSFQWDLEKTEAENLLLGREKLLHSYGIEKAKNPALSLGRFALRAEKYFCTHSNQDIKSKPAHFDVVVAGGGTAGALAALYAARGGAKTILIEPQYDLGGTSTLGGVSTYWFGNRYRDSGEIDREVDRLHQMYGIGRRPGLWSQYDDFHAGVRGLVLLKLCLEAGVTVILGQIAYDVLKKKDRICGIKSAGQAGKINMFASLVIDATGDGDLANAAGAQTVYGSSRDCITYWASLAQYTGTSGYRNNFSSMVVSSDPEDMTRFAVLGRQRGDGIFDHGAYISMRESRHIVGKKVINLQDLCMFRTYEDGLYTCFSNYDPKGKLDADMVYCGYLPPQIKMQVPLSALMPMDQDGQVIRGLYVAGKAISATHNAFPGLRMQPDLMHQGAVLGMLAACSAQQGCLVEELPASQRRNLIQSVTGDDLTLPDTVKYNLYDNASPDFAFYAGRVTELCRTHWIDVPFTYEETEVSPLLVLVCGDSWNVLPCIQERILELDGPGNRRSELTMLKRLALFHGCDDYTGEIEQDIIRQLQGSSPYLPERKGSVMCAQLLPDHGVMPEIVYDLNLLSGGKSFSMKPFTMVLELLEMGERDYMDIKKGIYSYMESFAYVARRSRRLEFIPLLKRLAELPEFKEATQEEYQVSLLAERLQTLMLLFYRALAELGTEEGREGLERMKHVSCLAIRKSAEMGLKATGPFGDCHDRRNIF